MTAKEEDDITGQFELEVNSARKKNEDVHKFVRAVTSHASPALLLGVRDEARARSLWDPLNKIFASVTRVSSVDAAIRLLRAEEYDLILAESDIAHSCQVQLGAMGDWKCMTLNGDDGKTVRAIQEFCRVFNLQKPADAPPSSSRPPKPQP